MRFKIVKGNGVLAGYAETIEDVQEVCDTHKGWSYKLPKDVTHKETVQHVTWLMINKQLEPFGITYSNVKKGAKGEFVTVNLVFKRKFLCIIPYTKYSTKKVVWYQYYTFKGKEEFLEWKQFCIETMQKYLKFNKEKAENEFAWFNLAYGLKQDYEIYPR